MDKKINRTQDWIPIEKILDNGIIKLKKNKYIKIINILPINFNLKSQLEKDSILNSYKIFLKTCNFNFQILIQSDKKDLSKNISKIKNNIKKDSENYLNNIAEEYIKYINELNSNKKSDSKNFYIIISNNNEENNEDVIIEELNENYFKIKECLSRCGNVVSDITNKNDIIKIFYSFFNPKNNYNN
jgi:hypothetical protein